MRTKFILVMAILISVLFSCNKELDDVSELVQTPLS